MGTPNKPPLKRQAMTTSRGGRVTIKKGQTRADGIAEQDAAAEKAAKAKKEDTDNADKS